MRLKSTFRFILFVVLLSISIAQPGQAQSESSSRRVDIDTVEMCGLRVGLDLQTLSHFIHTKLDTMIWGGTEGSSIVRFNSQFLEYSGELRLATEAGLVTQIMFSVEAKTADGASKDFIHLSNVLTNIYGGPDEVYANTMRITRWMGKQQDLVLKTADGSKFVSIILKLLPSKMQRSKMPKLKNGKE